MNLNVIVHVHSMNACHYSTVVYFVEYFSYKFEADYSKLQISY